MFVPAALVIAALIVGVLLIAAAIVGTAAWYGLFFQREEERQRLLNGAWCCDRCGTTMRFVGQTMDGGPA